uniref:Alliinase C-terminal domain-containing protein n=1 Tax=Kalanchoe fedtschenkoi TaxID=63787 RepID=A0A7N0VG66_KALFE
MGKGWNSAMYWRHLLVLSLAINIGLVAKVLLFQGAENEERLCAVEAGAEGAHFSKKAAHVNRGVGKGPSLVVAHGGRDRGRVVNLDHGDPTMYEMFWKRMDEETTIVIPGWQSVSYFSDPGNPCWFMEPEFAKQVVRIHRVVGNAVTENRYIVVGTGSTQLYQAALYALAPTGDDPNPMDVVSVAPFYSSYPLMTDFLKSGLYKWAGDAKLYDKEGPYIELVTSPNNPDGEPRTSVVNRSQGVLIHDFAYYWPQYAPITSAADHDLMLFTVSKSTGHAGIRIGWALVKDKEVAMKMTKFIELNTIGVSKDSQLRAAKILKATSDSCEGISNSKVENFFEFSFNQMTLRWMKLRAAVRKSGLFSLPDFSSEWCAYNQQAFKPQPGLNTNLC